MILLKKFIQLKKKFINWIDHSNKWFISNLSKPNSDFQKVTPTNIRVGSFYFLKYDLAGLNKSTNIEKYSIVFVVDYKPLIDSKVFWAINFNFLPSEIRRNFFLNFLNEKYDYIFNNNEKKKDWFSENPIPDVTYKKILIELAKFGVVYTKSIRAFRIDLINEIYGISTKNLEKLISLDVRPISGMDDAGIVKVLSGKLRNEGVEAIINDIKINEDYEKILEDLKERFKKVEEELNSL